MSSDVAVVAVGMGGRGRNCGFGGDSGNKGAVESSRFSDLVHKIVTRVAQQQDSPSKPPPPSPAAEDAVVHPHDPYLLHGPAAVTGQNSSVPPIAPPSSSSTSEGGPLASEEIKALLLLSATDDDDDNQDDDNARAAYRQDNSLRGFASVERDEIVNLVEYLQAHVNFARQRGMVVDEAHSVWMHGSQLGSPTQASMALARVRTKTQFRKSQDWSRRTSSPQLALMSHGTLACSCCCFRRRTAPTTARTFFSDAQWLKDRAPRHLAALTAGIDAACVILRIAATHNVHLRAVNEDAIGAAIALARAHLTKNLIPSLLPPGARGGGGGGAGEASPGMSPAASSPSSRRKIEGAAGSGGGGTGGVNGLAAAEARELAKVHRIVLSGTVDAYLKLIEQTDHVVRTVPLEDQQVLMLISGAMRALELDAAAGTSPTAHALQVSTVSILTSVFRHFPHHRATLLEDLFVLLPRINSTKRAVRSAHISYKSVECSAGFAAWNAALAGNSTTAIPRTMQMFTALLLSLLLGVVERPAYVEPHKEKEPDADVAANAGKEEAPDDDDEGEDDEDDDDGTSSSDEAKSKAAASSSQPSPDGDMDSSIAVEFRSGLEALHLWADTICFQLLKRVKMSKGDRDYRPLLSNLVEDLLVVWTIPEYSVAEALLLALVRRLTMDISQKSPQCLKALNSPMEHAESIETTYLNVAFDQLGRIAAAQARLLRENRDAPLLPTDAHGTRAEPCKCYCGGTSSAKVEVTCDRCGARYHGPCVGLKRDATIEDWHCDACRLAGVLDRSSVGPRSPSDAASPLLDATYALQHGYVSQLAHREGLPAVRAATRYHLARWADHLATADLGDFDGASEAMRSKRHNDFEKAKRVLVLRILEHWDGPGGPAAEALTETGTIRMIVATMVHASPFLAQFKAQVSNLLKFLNDDIHAFRKLSLKAIEKVRSAAAATTSHVLACILIHFAVWCRR